MLTFGSLFAGIGGFDLGFERAGMTCKWQVEIDDYANRVLERHWPDVPRYRDIRAFPCRPGGVWHPSSFAVDVICGGFPCQDISSSGSKAGIAGRQSSLWFEMLRVVRLLGPRIVVVENVADIAVRGLDAVLGSLAESGFDAEWDVLPACVLGLPQRRERLFVVAHACGRRLARLEERDSERPNPKRRAHVDGLAMAERRAASATRVVRGMDAGVPDWLDTSR